MSLAQNNYMGIQEAAAFLGRSESALRSLVFRRLIPYRKVGGRLTFIRNELTSWVDQRCPGLRPEEIREMGLKGEWARAGGHPPAQRHRGD